MSYLVLARKYRPQTFAEILGQEPIVTTLTNAIRQNRIGQAYLFSGPRGTGKTSTARIFAKALNCEKGPTAAPCMKCNLCQEIAEGRSLDVLEIDGASNRGIDQIRALRELAKFSPSVGKFKVYIIDEVHQITPEGFNALLKTLEEPPAHVLFILATTAAYKVPATIVSRCQRFEFKRLPLKVIAEKLKGVCGQEKLKISNEALLGIAKAASGSLRDAESILDQVAAFSDGKIEAQDLQTLLGTIDEDQFVEAIQAIRARDAVVLLRRVAESADAGVELGQWTLGLLGFVRNLLVARVGAGSLGFEEMEQENGKRLSELARQFALEELVMMAQLLTAALETMRRVSEPRIPLEVALVRLSSADSFVTVAELVNRLEKLDRRGGPAPTSSAQARPSSVRPAAAPPPAPAPQQKPTSASAAASAPPAGSGVEKILSVWPSLIEALHNRKAGTAAYLNEGTPISLHEEEPPRLVIGFRKGQEFHCHSLEQMQTKQLIEQSLAELLGHPVRCIFEVVENFPAADPKAPAAVSPLIHSVLELFEGRVLPGEGTALP